MATKFKEYDGVNPAILIKYGLDILFDSGQVFEVRIPRQAGQTISGYFDDTGLASLAIAKENARIVNPPKADDKFAKAPPTGIYVTLNPIQPKLLARAANAFNFKAETTTNDKEIAWRRWFPIDLDPVRPAGISSTDEEVQASWEKAEEIKNWLKSLNWPEPIMALSGNGTHLLYQIDLPNDDNSQVLCEFATKMIAGLFSDDKVNVDKTVWNASRIFKVYGTVAAKGSHTEDRPHRVAIIKKAPENIQPVPIDLLTSMADGLRNATKEDFRDNSGEYISDMPGWLADRGQIVTSGPRVLGDGGKKWTVQNCPFNPTHKNPMVGITASGGPVFRCLHDSCEKYKWSDFRVKIDPDYADPDTIKKRIIEFCTSGDNSLPSGELIENIFELKKKRNKTLTDLKKSMPKDRFALLVAAVKEEERARKKAVGVEFNDKQNVLGLIQTVRLWQDADDIPIYWRNEFDHRIRVGTPGDLGAERYDRIHEIKLMLKFHERNEVWVKVTHTSQVIEELASERVINPMKLHLKSYKWDGVKRLETWLIKFMGVVDNEYTRAVGMKWMISAAARGMNPGCQADHMLILEGEQGIGKSQCLRILGGDYYVEYSRAISGNNTGHKDMVASVIGKLIIEMSELATLRRGDMETLKAILTTTHDEARLAYERDSKTYPRTCVFAGTTNELEGNYIADYSGARRFWPVRCGATGRPDIAGLRAARDQLWAEAVYMYEQGEDWYIVPQEMAKAEQAERQMTPAGNDPWFSILTRALTDENMYANSVIIPQVRYELGQPTDDITLFLGPFDIVMSVALGIDMSRQTTHDGMRVRSICKQMGFEKIRSRRAVSGSTNQYQLRKEKVPPELWEEILRVITRSQVFKKE